MVNDGGSISYVANTLEAQFNLAQITSDQGSAQEFVLLQDSGTDTLYNLVGVNGGVFDGLSLGGQYGIEGPDASQPFYMFLENLASGPQHAPSGQGNQPNFGNRGVETAIWQIDLTSLALTMIWTNPAGSSAETSVLTSYIENQGDGTVLGGEHNSQFEDEIFTLVNLSLGVVQ